jgi:hypothetical protein
MEGKIGEEGNKEGKETFLTIHKNTKTARYYTTHNTVDTSNRKEDGGTYFCSTKFKPVKRYIKSHFMNKTLLQTDSSYKGRPFLCE